MKKTICLIVLIAMLLSISVTAFADYSGFPVSGETTEENTRAEETEWHYRITDDGLLQMRLWSITYGYWKTDWITIGYV